VSTAPASQVSTSTVVGVQTPNPFELNLLYDDHGYRFQLDYRLRWDNADIFRLPSAARRWVLHPLDTLGGNARNIAAGTRIGFYGFRLKPSRAVVYTSASGSSRSAGAAAGEPRKARLDLHPVVEDLRSDLYRGLRRTAIDQGMDLMLPWARSASYGQKEQIYKDLLDAQRSLGGDIIYEPYELYEP